MATYLGRVFFDAHCGLCRGLRHRFGSVFTTRGWRFEPLQDVIRTGEFAIPADEFHREMKLLAADGRWSGGADAWIVLLKSVWWLRPVGVLLQLPVIHGLTARAYAHLASRRHCVINLPGQSGAKAVAREGRIKGAPGRPRLPLTAFIPLAVLPALALVAKPALEPWVFMWVLAFAIFSGCKWLTWQDARTRGVPYSAGVSALYLACWTGMNAVTLPEAPTTRR
ncbi:MAG TPA: hypothetical protein DCY13_04195, partial [Verrucomicrobiales bacterium]|nr:hypothetical protein [Verrucomicrobiales bacterium]